jgi:hypothetical protein
MRNAFMIAGIFTLATALAPTATLAQSNDGGGMAASSMAAGSASGAATAQSNANISGDRSLARADHVAMSGKKSVTRSTHITRSSHVNGTKSLARADIAAGSHGLKGRNVARTHGANKPGFCPPGQAKKPGLGSRFQC